MTARREIKGTRHSPCWCNLSSVPWRATLAALRSRRVSAHRNYKLGKETVQGSDKNRHRSLLKCSTRGRGSVHRSLAPCRLAARLPIACCRSSRLSHFQQSAVRVEEHVGLAVTHRLLVGCNMVGPNQRSKGAWPVGHSRAGAAPWTPTPQAGQTSVPEQWRGLHKSA